MAIATEQPHPLLPDRGQVVPLRRAEVTRAAERMLTLGLKCGVEVRDPASSCAERWMPRMLVPGGPGHAADAIEETMRLSPYADVRLVGYARRSLRRRGEVLAIHQKRDGLAGLEQAALAATRAAATACLEWIGRGDGKAADAAATEAMRATLLGAPGHGTVVIGEGEKDDAPMLHNGERLGSGDGPAFDIAVDPLECTAFCANGLPGALATIAVAEAGSMWSPGPAFYMDKLVVGQAARDSIDLREEPEENLRRVALALGKEVRELRVTVLDKPRHTELIARLREAGAAVQTPAEGDVAGALAALLADGQADILMGVGGTPEGVMTACAAAALGGGMQARLAPQRDDEALAVEQGGMDTARVMTLEELVSGPSLFAATGVTGGALLRASESILVTAAEARRV